MRTYPAYARTISRLLVRGKHPACIAVLLSARWWHFDRAVKVCIRPEEWEFGRWEFGYLKGEHVVAVFGDEAELVQFGELLLELMLAGPREIWACNADGSWIYRDSLADTLAAYADECTGRKRSELAKLARERYEAAQARENDLILREAERATQLGRPQVSFVQQRKAALQIATALFSDPHATVNAAA